MAGGRRMEPMTSSIADSSIAAYPVRMAVTTPRCTLDFDDVDLSTPKSSPTDDVLVPPFMVSDADLSCLNAPQGGHVPALPLSALNPGTEQHHPLNPTVINGNLGTMMSSSNPPVGMKASLRPPLPAVYAQSRPPVQARVNQNCHGGPGSGYSGASTDGGKRRSSPLDPAQGSAGTSCPTNTDRRALLITEAAAKQAFQEYGNGKCCYGSSPAKDMTTEELQPFNTYRYSLETFTESRICEWITAQYTGQHVDAPNAGSVLQPWEIPVVVPDMFKDGAQTMKVPNTTCVKTCSNCKGMGKNMCLKCHGTGRIQCMWCNGTGRRLQMEMCQQCYGVGTESCRMCNISYIQTCVTCAGTGQVLTYLQLSTTWKNNKYQFLSDHHSEFSADLFQAVHGERIHTEEQLSATPLSDFPDSSITWASQNALEQHRMQFSSSCRVLRQRQSVELIPLTKVQYVWKGKKLNYFVYGMENKVFAQNYPQKCCCAVM
ncbi:protein SSUH2 homolog [Phyllobates terribilis]|uniref:protein SSUH2 homolog n=1 Tax=Phyllobates terribilis TaxID=111132 RepID=UPI003CCB0408